MTDAVNIIAQDHDLDEMTPGPDYYPDWIGRKLTISGMKNSP